MTFASLYPRHFRWDATERHAAERAAIERVTISARSDAPPSSQRAPRTGRRRRTSLPALVHLFLRRLRSPRRQPSRRWVAEPARTSEAQRIRDRGGRRATA